MFRRQAFRVGILATAALLLESTLTRLLAVAQFYHFAFLVVSLALLGYGASGTLLIILPPFSHQAYNLVERLLPRLGFGFFLSVIVAYGVVNFLPFDSYSIAWDPSQVAFFVLYYLVLALPFLMSGLATGTAIEANRDKNHLIYAANLLGSSLGVILAPLALWLAGVPGAVLLSAGLGLWVALPLVQNVGVISKKTRLERLGLLFIMVITGLTFCILSVLNLGGHSPLGMTLSPYKALSQVLRYPGAETVFSRWNAVSRTDLVANAGIHRLPGLSYTYQGDIPPQLGLSVDADTLQPVTLIQPDQFQAATHLPESLVFQLLPASKILVLQPGGGLGILQALSGGADAVTAVVSNPLEPFAVGHIVTGINIFNHPKVSLVYETSRVFLSREDNRYDVVYFPLTDPYRPVTSGAFSLTEDYTFTVEGFESALECLSSGGILVVTRWLQIPPSESLRLVAILAEAVRGTTLADPGDLLVMYRGIQTMTILLKPSGWDSETLQKVRTFTADRKFDLVWVPDIQLNETNRYNRLSDSIYFQAVAGLLSSTDRAAYYQAYQFDITPPRDTHPFFFHFFKWEQTPEVLGAIGHTWQPFGGSGYLVLFVFLILAIVLSLVLICLPLLFLSRGPIDNPSRSARWRPLAYFTFLGFGFLFVEIPLIQAAILLLGHPIYAFTVVVFTLLLFSGLGSILARAPGLPRRLILVFLVAITFLVPLYFPRAIGLALGWMLPFRILAVALSLAPLAFLMGFPFPFGLIALEDSASGMIPWVWSVNGTVSVVASVLAAILALSYGFTIVHFIGAVLYAAAAGLFLFPGHKFLTQDR